VVLRVTENMLGILLAGGLDPQDAAWGCDILVMLVTAVASEDDVRRARGRSDAGDRRAYIDEIHRTFAGLPPDRFPLITAHAAEMVAGDGDERFHFAIDVVVDGMIARAARR
jgi:hypothetical protein